jgi:o-succinylbenzoate synthase
MLKNVSSDEIEDFICQEPAQAGLLINSFPYPLSQLLSQAYFHRRLLMRKDLAANEIKLSALIGETSAAQASVHAKLRISQGFRCLKIKVGDLAVHEEINKIKNIAAFHKGLTLRLDANKRFSLADASTLLRGLEGVNIEYFEEPLKNEAELPILHEQSGVELAIDESFREGASLDFIVAQKARYFILKPSRFSSIFAVQQWCKEAASLGITPIFSTCFESDFFCSLMALLIADLGLHDTTHGLLIDDLFVSNLTPRPLRSIDAKISLSEAFDIVSYDLKALII